MKEPKYDIKKLNFVNFLNNHENSMFVQKCLKIVLK